MKKLLLLFLWMFPTVYTFAQWNSNPTINTQVATRDNGQFMDGSISDGAGGVIFVFTTRFQDAMTNDWLSQIFAQRLDLNGIPQWGAAGKLITTTSEYTSTYVVTDGNGGAVIMYNAYANNNLGAKIYAQRLNSNGDKQWGANTIEITPTADDYWLGNVIYAPGEIVFTYNNDDNSYAQKLNLNNGSLAWGANGIQINDINAGFEVEGIYKHGTGYVVLFYEEYEDVVADEDAARVYIQKLDASGSKVGTNVLLQDYVPSGGYRYEPQDLVYDGNGGFYVATVADNNSTAKLYLQHFLSDGTKAFTDTNWGIEVDDAMGKPDNGYMRYEVAIENDGAGGVILGWTDTHSSNYGYYAQRFSNIGTKLWASNDLLITNAAGNYYGYTIVQNTDGDFVLSFGKDMGNNNNHIYVQKVSPPGTLLFDEPGVLLAGATGSKQGEMVVSGNKVILAFYESRSISGGGYTVYAQSLFNNGSLTGTFPVTNINTAKGFNTIQSAINHATTLNAHEIQLAAGIYTENVTINKEITLKGNNAGVAPWSWSNSPSVINPPATAFTYANALVTIAAHNVTIDGISFDGTNDNINDNFPRTINGKAVRTALGVVTGGGDIFNSPRIANGKFQNFTGRAIELYSDNNTPRVVEVADNQIDNVVAVNTTSAAGIAYGVFTYGFFGEIKNNRITRTSMGIELQFPFNFTNSNIVNALNNNVEAYKTGLSFRGASTVSAPIINVTSNAVTKADFNAWTAEGLNKTGINLTGMYFASLAGDNNVSVSNNNVTGANWGISTIYIQKSTTNPNRFTISGGTLSNNYLGVDNYIQTNNTYTTRVVLSGVNINNAGSGYTGVRNYAVDGTYKSEMVLKDGVQITNNAPTTDYSQAIRIEGANAQLNELNDTKISGAYNRFIAFISSAMSGLTVDGKDITYDGAVGGHTFNNYKPSATFDLTLRNLVKARIFDGETVGNSTAGIVTIPSTLPVSLIDFNASLKNNGTLLSWSTASELNNSHFIIEKSTDGVDFKTLTTVGGKGTTSEKSTYQFTDISFLQSTYYRLTQIDNNGTKTVYHDLVRYVKSFDAQPSVKVYPNPATDKIFVTTVNIKVGTEVKLINLQGKILASQTASQGTLVFETQQLPTGVYFVQYSTGTVVQSQKVVKK